MISLKQGMMNRRHDFFPEKALALATIVAGVPFLALGIHHSGVRPEPFGVPGFLGCVVGAFFLLLVAG